MSLLLVLLLHLYISKLSLIVDRTLVYSLRRKLAIENNYRHNLIRITIGYGR